jgi:hypothetical protein
MTDLTPGGAPSAPAANTPAPSTSPADVSTNTPAIDTTPAALEPVTNPDAALDSELAKAWDDAHSDGEEVDSTVNSNRDEQGRFKSTKPAAEPVLEGGEQKSDPTPPEGETGTETPPAPVHQPPPSWSGEAKAKLWSALPPEAQEYVSQRESAAHRAITQAGQRLKQYEPIDQIVREYASHFERHKVSPPDAFRALVEAQNHLENDPVGGLIQIGLSYGVDLRPLLGIEGGLKDTGSDPVVGALKSRIDQLESMVSEQRQRDQQAAQRQEQHEQQELHSTITEFSKDKPFFAEVRPTMAALLRSGQAEDLASAYDMAIHAVPAVRQRILQDQRKQDDERANAAVSRAKRAAAVNTRSIPATATPRSNDDELLAIAAKHYG